jgi:hypothetical protein
VLAAMFQFEQQANIKFSHKPGKSKAVIPVSLNAVYGVDTLMKSTV